VAPRSYRFADVIRSDSHPKRQGAAPGTPRYPGDAPWAVGQCMLSIYHRQPLRPEPIPGREPGV